MAGERVLVTGGTGFVGGLVLAALVAQGRQVRALVRREGDAARLPARPAELALGDLEDAESLARAADGCAVVYHAAGLNELCPRDPSRLYRTNVEGTRRVLGAARRAGVRRVVYTSSAAVLHGDGTRPADESSPYPERFTSHYARSKAEAEQVALGAAGEGLEVVAVLPSSVQGPGRVTGTGKLFLDYLNGKLPFVIPARFGLCYSADCAAGHLLAEAKGRPGQRYVLNGATLTEREALALVGEVAGISERPRTLPPGVALAAAAVVGGLARVRGRRPSVCLESVRTLSHPHLYDGSRAQRELGLRYTPVREALAATVRWYSEQGLLTRPLPGMGKVGPRRQ